MDKISFHVLSGLFSLVIPCLLTMMLSIFWGHQHILHESPLVFFLCSVFIYFYFGSTRGKQFRKG